jgi:hypothetical protein
MGFSSFLSKKPMMTYNNTLNSENGWKLTRHAPKGILNRLSRTGGQRIGHDSVFGSVYTLMHNGNNSRYVIKHIPFKNNKNRDRKHIFKTEVKIGGIRNIGRVGPRVIAYRMTPFGGNYVMDHVKMGDSRAKIFSLADVRSQITPDFWNKIKKKIKEFENITHGNHGDLHGDNILIVQSKKTGKTDIRIIDYGAHRTYKELKKKSFHSRKNGLKVYNVGPGQKFRRTKNLIKALMKKLAR